MNHLLSYLSSARRRTRVGTIVTAGLSFVFVLGSVNLPAATPGLEESEPFKSIFIDDPKFGKDPFFPRSTRRGRQALVAETNVVAVVTDDLVLKGLSGSPERRLAIINNYTFQAGEEYVVKAAGIPVKIRCIEIRDRSAIISVNGITKELRLRPKL